MVNIYGPGLTGDSATATRTPQLATGSGVDLWFQDCSSEDAQDGTRIRAQWLNFIMANLREAIRGMGVDENEVDDDMLLKCFRKQQLSNWINLPIYPEVQTPTAVLAVTSGSGQIVIDDNQYFLHRGWEKVATHDYAAELRTLAHSANKTYHLRWQYNNGAPAFVLKDLVDAIYNPGGAPESDTKFDSTYDDMLIGRLVTNGANAQTLTLLKNKALLTGEGFQNWNSGSVSQKDTGTAHVQYNFTLNWARTPPVAFALRRHCNEVSSGDYDMAITGGLFSSPLDGTTPVTDRYRMIGDVRASWTGTIALNWTATV